MAHADCRVSVSRPDRHHSGAARIADCVYSDSGDAGADAHRFLSLRLHAEPDYPVCADLLHRHSGGRRHRGGGKHRSPLADAGQSRPAAVRGRRRSGRRGRQPHYSGHSGRSGRDSADGVRRRTDGAVYAPHPDRRQRGDALFAAGRLHRDAVGRGADSQAGWASRGRTGGFRHAAVPALHGRLTASGGAAVELRRRRCGPAAGFGFAVLLGLRQGQDAAVRQQERVPGDRRYAQRHDPRRNRASDAVAGRRDQQAARGGECPDLRGNGVALQLQRAGAPLLPAARPECGGYSGESPAQGRARTCKATRSRSRCGCAFSPSRNAMERASK